MKEIEVILANFNCPLCNFLKDFLPIFCKERGWKLTQIVDDKGEHDYVEMYPHIKVKINDTIVDTIEGIPHKEIVAKLIIINKQYK